MKWTKALATGHELIDEQHRGLFRCLEQLEIATTEQRTLLAVYSITRLKHYIREHFETEEAVMRQCKFPKLQEHIAEHRNFRAKMTELQGQAVILDVSAEMVDFLAEWLTNHLAESDRDYVSYLEK